MALISCGGPKADVIAALDDAFAKADGASKVHVQGAISFARSDIALLPDHACGVDIRVTPQPNDGFTVSVSYAVYPEEQ